MRTSRTLAVTVAAGAFIGLAAPTASAWDGNSITVSPSTTHRGGSVSVMVNAHECRTNGHVSSSAFPNTPLNWNGGVATANVTIGNNAHIGAHDVTATCGTSVTKSQALTVYGGAHGGEGGSVKSGATSTDMAIGGSLVAAAVIGGGVFWLRRRGESRA
ncbi:hypothetical protein ACFQVC_36215 [Streptomyces monticola]|uniref:LPXTG cell wall anchor domain-containing protein n=1 Tax=Streptomyces monticola TaxID=2666263 RepID=A0ABW2JWH8_9ACTN